MKNGLCGKENLVYGSDAALYAGRLDIDEITGTSFYSTSRSVKMEEYERVEWKNGWDAYWQAKRIADCPYVGEKADLWCAGYALAEKVGYEEEMQEATSLWI